jgi:hypothetical protein
MSNKKGNSKYKDNIFRYLFSDENNFVQLYYDLIGEKLDPSELNFMTQKALLLNS